MFSRLTIIIPNGILFLIYVLVTYSVARAGERERYFYCINEKIVNLWKTPVMTHAERYIIETYSVLFEGLNSVSKLELLERLAKSIKKGKKTKEKDFFSSFGAFASDKPADEIVKEIRESRKFRKKDLKF